MREILIGLAVALAFIGVVMYAALKRQRGSFYGDQKYKIDCGCFLFFSIVFSFCSMIV